MKILDFLGSLMLKGELAGKKKEEKEWNGNISFKFWIGSSEGHLFCAAEIRALGQVPCRPSGGSSSMYRLHVSSTTPGSGELLPGLPSTAATQPKHGPATTQLPSAALQPVPQLPIAKLRFQHMKPACGTKHHSQVLPSKQEPRSCSSQLSHPSEQVLHGAAPGSCCTQAAQTWRCSRGASPASTGLCSLVHQTRCRPGFVPKNSYPIFQLLSLFP